MIRGYHLRTVKKQGGEVEEARGQGPPPWLIQGEMEPVGQVVETRNDVFLVRLDDGERQHLAIYKPCEGEYPLWDFPQGTLCLRERAAYLLSRVLGWPRIPPTILRDGFLGPGSVQQFIEFRPEANYFTLQKERRADFLPVALFDHVVNNADRKAGHLLFDAAGRLWAIDQALTFHIDLKLRTVIWDFAGEPIPVRYLDDLRHVRLELAPGHDLEAALSDLLSAAEMTALRERIDNLLVTGVFPQPDPDRVCLPWPLV